MVGSVVRRSVVFGLALVLAVPVSAVVFRYTESSHTGNDIALGYPVPLPVDSLTPVDGFRSYASLHARHQALDSASARIAGSRLGATANGRDIWAYTLSDADTTTDDGGTEPAMLINAGIHAREWSTPEFATGLLERFAERESETGLYRYLLDNVQLVVVPVLNVDGFLQTQRFPAEVTDSRDTPRDGRMRRKNMRGVDEDLASLGDNLLGIDLNRNNEPFWASSTRSSDSPSSLVYHGPGPASEPETQALQAAATLAGPRLRLYVDTHSYSQVFITPMTGNGRRDTLAAALAGRMRAVTANRYAYDPGPVGLGIGATDEYFAHRFQIPSYTLETEPGPNGASQYGGLGVSHDGFILPANQVARVRNELADALSLAIYRQAGPPAVLRARVERLDTGAPVFEAVWQRSGAARNLVVLTRTALSAGGHRLRLSFDKPMRVRDAAGAVVDYAGQGVVLAPTLVLEGRRADGTAFSQSLTASSAAWQAGAGQFLRYPDDSLSADFELAADSPALSAPLVQLALTVQDFSGQSLDSDPATPVDWGNGAWDGYERDDGSASDVGGTDRRLRLKDDGSPLFIPPAPAPPPSPPPTPPATGGGGGGGGSLGYFFFVTFVGLIAVRERRIIPALRKVYALNPKDLGLGVENACHALG